MEALWIQTLFNFWAIDFPMGEDGVTLRGGKAVLHPPQKPIRALFVAARVTRGLGEAEKLVVAASAGRVGPWGRALAGALPAVGLAAVGSRRCSDLLPALLQEQRPLGWPLQA